MSFFAVVKIYRGLGCMLFDVDASTFPHCSMKSTEYLWPITKRLVKDERRSKSKLCVCA